MGVITLRYQICKTTSGLSIWGLLDPSANTECGVYMPGHVLNSLLHVYARGSSRRGDVNDVILWCQHPKSHP